MQPYESTLAIPQQDMGWVSELRNIWIGTTPPATTDWEWIRLPDAMVVCKQTAYLALEWNLGDNLLNGLEYLKVTATHSAYPFLGICIYERNPQLRGQMVQYLKDTMPRVGFNPSPDESSWLDRAFRVYESDDNGRTWQQIYGLAADGSLIE